MYTLTNSGIGVLHFARAEVLAIVRGQLHFVHARRLQPVQYDEILVCDVIGAHPFRTALGSVPGDEVRAGVAVHCR